MNFDIKNVRYKSEDCNSKFSGFVANSLPELEYIVKQGQDVVDITLTPDDPAGLFDGKFDYAYIISSQEAELLMAEKYGKQIQYDVDGNGRWENVNSFQWHKDCANPYRFRVAPDLDKEVTDFLKKRYHVNVYQKDYHIRRDQFDITDFSYNSATGVFAYLLEGEHTYDCILNVCDFIKTRNKIEVTVPVYSKEN